METCVFGLICIFVSLLLICTQSSFDCILRSVLFRGLRVKSSARWQNVNVCSCYNPSISWLWSLRMAALTVAASPGRARDTVVGVQVTEVRGRGQVHQVPGGWGLHLGVSGQESSPWSYTSQTHLRGRPGGWWRDGSIVNKPERNSLHPTFGIRNL